MRGVSDLHGALPEIEPCDVLVLAGDLVPLELQADATRSRNWFSTVFAAWLDGVPATEVVGVAGNHDFMLSWDLSRGVHRWLFDANWTYLQDAGVRLECGLSVWGTPWSPGTSDWAFSSDEQALREAFKDIPDGLDVLITHTPPFGKGDRAPAAPDPLLGHLNDYRHIGSRELQHAIHRARPRLVVFGHVHADGGWRIQIDDTLYANVSVLDEAYRLVRSASEPLLHTAESA